jgi:hypothetical protein
VSSVRKKWFSLALTALVAGFAASGQTNPPEKVFSNLISEIDKQVAAPDKSGKDQGLRPPKGLIPPSFWERYRIWVFAGAGVLLTAACGLIWYVRRPLPDPVIPPELQARRDLEAAAREPDPGVLLSHLSRILRHYVTQAFGLPQEELTTREFAFSLRNHPGIPEELVKTLTSFLQQCDERKFSPTPPDQPSEPVAAALDLINKTEKSLEQQRAAASQKQ